jgi:hypothetical protein
VRATVVVVLIFMFSFSSQAQAIRSWGFKIGAVSAFQTWDYASPFSDFETQHRLGVDVAVFAEWLDLRVFSISTECHYVQKGMAVSLPITTTQFPDGTGEYWTRSPRLDYLSIPVLAKIRLPDQRIAPYILIGPRLDLLLTINGDGFEVVLDKFRRVDFGGVLGIGMEINVREFASLGGEFRFSPSFADGYSTALTTVRNSSMEFLLVIGF